MNELSKNLGAMYELMKNYNFTIIDDVKENLFCIKCRKLLVDSCQIGCGCKFCRDCLQLLIKDDFTHCPGTTKYCENMNLVEFNADFCANIDISNLKVKCPETICSYECKLIEMFEHIRLCEKKFIKCPLQEFGCKSEKNTFEKINEHIQSNSYDHIKLLTGIMEILRNEITEMKNSDLINKIEIESLKCSFEAELKQIRVDTNKQLENNGLFLRNLQVEIDSLNFQFNNFQMGIQLKIDQVKQENQIRQENSNILNDKISEIKSYIDGSIGKIEQKLNNIHKEIFDKLETKSESSFKPFDKRIVKLEKNLEKQFDEIFQWKIYDIDNQYESDDWISSGYFYGRINPYKMQLIFLKHEFGWRFRLRVYPTEIDFELKWPFRKNIMLSITSEYSEKVCQKELIGYEIEEPIKNQYNISCPLEFSKSELELSEHWNSKWFIVECLVG